MADNDKVKTEQAFEATALHLENRVCQCEGCIAGLHAGYVVFINIRG